MAVSSLFMTNLLGHILISRYYRGRNDPDTITNFMSHLLKNEEDNQVCPVFSMGQSSYAFVKHNNLYFIAVLQSNSNITLVFSFFYKLISLMSEYFEEVNEESVQDNFVVIHELLDEVLDFGYPQTTEGRILKEYITQEGSKLETRRIPSAVTNAVSWRPEGIKYKKNELFIDVLETVDLTGKANGTVVRSEVLGTIVLKTRLSGMPELHLGLNDKILGNAIDYGDSVDLDEAKFHQCVRLWKFERDRSITFVPPDGEFELMSYRISSHAELPIVVTSTVEIFPGRRIEYALKAVPRFKSPSLASAVVIVPVPPDADTPVLTASAGTVRYRPEKDAIVWDLPTLRGAFNAKELTATGRFGLPSVSGGEPFALGPIRVQFIIPFFQLSGIKIKFVHAIEKSGYSIVSWLRHQTQSGDYVFRQREIWHHAAPRPR